MVVRYVQGNLGSTGETQQLRCENERRRSCFARECTLRRHRILPTTININPQPCPNAETIYRGFRAINLLDGDNTNRNGHASLAHAHLLLPEAHRLAQQCPRGLARRRRLRKLGHPEEVAPIRARLGQVRHLEADGNEALRSSLDGWDGLVLVAVRAGDEDAPAAGRRTRVA